MSYPLLWTINMKLVLSPAKSLDYETKLPTTRTSEGLFFKEAEQLNKILKKKSAKDLSKLMKISDNLGQLNYERNQEWELPFTNENARQAIYAFSGDVYRGLDAYTIDIKKIDKVQDTVRILSGLYGVLKPLDLIQPYRLEMGTKMPVGKNKNLYEFWNKKVTQALNDELEDDELFLNLASNEYFKAIDTKALKVPVVNVVFKEFKNGNYKIIAFFAKVARGLMARYIIDTDAKTIDDVKGFNYENYGFSEELSSENELVFTR
ncbi:hypothetical protein DFQ11_107146 [Winogradskyella epiphytica]|uniref:UPF0246 protein DFQ11_107146 n=2 Tax=Winogradskyella epiphytica TaxID=262005 RepID=A0A2V4XX20_9FLAO|nr:hypothetical protein DFQ11_107146 [Winogradskyella epiphytica]